MIKKLATVKEWSIEQELVARVLALGGVCDKVCTVGRRGFFDRLIILPGPRIIFCELKRPRGGRVSDHQKQYASRYEALGAEVAIVRTLEDIDKLLKS